MSAQPPPYRGEFLPELDEHRRTTGQDLNTTAGEHRYGYYRRKGHGPFDAWRYALAWEVNVAEQRKRRLAHDTGAQ